MNRCRCLTRRTALGAKAEIHALVRALARDGMAILLISSELPEVLDLSGRMVVMRAGRAAGEVPRERATQESRIGRMTGVTPAEETNAP
jgi:ABC-type sugar transport system ATPase subunit